MDEWRCWGTVVARGSLTSHLQRAAMTSVQYLRAFVTERLTAAAAEIFGVFEKIIIEYEEEIERQRQLQNADGPETGGKLHVREFPQQDVPERDSSSSLDQTDPQLPQIKEEQEELGTSQDVVQLVLKQESDSFMLTSAYEESESDPEPNSDTDLLFHSSPVAQSQDVEDRNYVDPGSAGNAEDKPRRHKATSDGNNVETSPVSETQSNTQSGEKSIECDFCGKAFKYKYNLKRHLRIHTGEKPYVCNTCGKRYSQMSILKRHIKIHTGEKPYSCKICRKRFCQKTQLQRHMNIHTRGESNP